MSRDFFFPLFIFPLYLELREYVSRDFVFPLFLFPQYLELREYVFVLPRTGSSVVKAATTPNITSVIDSQKQNGGDGDYFRTRNVSLPY